MRFLDWHYRIEDGLRHWLDEDCWCYPYIDGDRTFHRALDGIHEVGEYMTGFVSPIRGRGDKVRVR